MKTFIMSIVLYACMWLAFQTTGGLLNPAVGVSVGFNDQWNHRLLGIAVDPLWYYFWIAWLVGPMVGAIFAVPVFKYYE